MTIPTDPSKKPIDEIENWNLDRSVEPYAAVRGMMYKSGGTWLYWDRTITLSADASGSRVSAIQSDATNLNVSAKSSDAGTLLVSAKQGDAGLLRVSAIGAGMGNAYTTNQISIASASPTAIVGVNNARQGGVLIINHSSTDIYIGGASVTSSNGILLTGTKGTAMTIPTLSALYGITSATGQTVSYIEL